MFARYLAEVGLGSNSGLVVQSIDVKQLKADLHVSSKLELELFVLEHDKCPVSCTAVPDGVGPIDDADHARPGNSILSGGWHSMISMFVTSTGKDPLHYSSQRMCVRQLD